MAIIGIVAISRNYAIGKDGKLPWHYSADLRFFKETTTGHTVVMGSNTWRSIGKPLPNRLNIVLTRSREMDLPGGVIKFGSKGQVVALANYLEGDIYVIGGAKTYVEFADVIDRWVVTEIPETIGGADTFFDLSLLDAFEIGGTRELGDDLIVKFLHRK